MVTAISIAGFCRDVVNTTDTMEDLVTLLLSQHPQVREQGARWLGVPANDRIQYRDSVLYSPFKSRPRSTLVQTRSFNHLKCSSMLCNIHASKGDDRYDITDFYGHDVAFFGCKLDSELAHYCFSGGASARRMFFV
jgi:hypothetical protein